MSSHITSADGTSIAFDAHGPTDAPTIILIHGATASRAVQSAPAAISKLTGMRVIEYDRRGRGESGDTLPYAVQREAEDIAALMDAAGGPAWLLGESSGATLALEALLNGVSAIGLLLYEPPIVADHNRPPVPADFIERLDTHLAAGRRDLAFAQFSIEGIGMPAEMVGDVTKSPYWSFVEPVAHTLAYDARVCGNTMSGSSEPLRRFSSITTPTTIMVGSETFPYMHTGAQALADAMPNAHVVTFDSAGHQLIAEVVAPLLIETIGAAR